MPAPTKDSSARRHKFVSLAAKSKAQHVNLKKKTLDFSVELEASSANVPPSLAPSPFSLHLQHLSLLNLSTPFAAFQKQITPLASTFPLLLFNSSEIIETIISYLSRPQDEPSDGTTGAIPAILELLPALAQSLLDSFLPKLKDVLLPLFQLSDSAPHLPMLFPAFAGLLKPLSPLLLLPGNRDVLDEVWAVWKPWLVLTSKGGNASGEEQRRLAVEGWGSVVRRGGRGEGGERLVGMMVQDVVQEEEEGTVGLKDGVGLVLVEAMKGPPATLHSRSAHLLKHLATLLLSLPSTSSLPTVLLPNVLTALIHHVNTKPVAFEEILQVLLVSTKAEIQAVTKAIDPSEKEIAGLRLERMLKSLVTVASIRKGRCVTSTYLPQFLALLPPILALVPSPTTPSSTTPLSTLYLALLSSLLPIGKLPDWLAHRTSLERFWSSTNQAGRKALVGCFVNDPEDGGGWRGGGEVLVRGLVERETLGDLESYPEEVLGLLRTLARAGVLEGLNGKWRESLASGLGRVLEALPQQTSLSYSSIPSLCTLLPLLPSLSSHRELFLPSLVNILRLLLASTKSSDFSEGPANATYALGRVLETLGELFDRSSEGSEEAVGLLLEPVEGGESRLVAMVKELGTLRVVLKGLSRFMSSLRDSLTSVSLHSLLPLVQFQLLSEDALVRTSTLSILAVLKPSSLVIKRSLEVEETPLTVKDARERCVRIAKVSRAIVALGGGLEEEMAAEVDVGVRSLVAQFKVNLRPLWPETCKALAEVSTVRAEAVWQILYAEATKATTGDRTLFIAPEPEWLDSLPEDDADGKEGRPKLGEEEEEKTFRDPYMRKAEIRVVDAMTGQVGRLLEMAELQTTSERLDILNYEMELIHGLTAAPAMAEKHGRDTVPLFLNFARPVSVSDSMDVDVDPSSPSSPVRLSQRLIHLKLICYLELFAKFKNPKALYRSDELYELYLALLAKGENKIQKLSLDCVLTYKSFRITPYRDNLTMLLDEVRFRDQLAKFSLSTYGDAIDPSHRSELIPLVIRLLYGLMITRKGRSSSSQGPAARKQAILASFAGCSSGELQTLVDLMLAPFSGFESEAGPSGGFAFVEGSTFIPGKQQVGYLSLLGDVLKHLGPQLVQSWPRLLGTTMQLVNLAQVQLGQKTVDPASVPEEAEKVEKAAEEEEEDDQEENEGPARAHHTAPTRTIRQIGLKRIADFFRSPVEFDFTPYLPFAFASFISPRLAALDAENTQAPSGLLELFAGWSTKREQIPFLVEYDAQVLPKIYDCLTATNVKPSVISKIYDIVERLLALTAEEDDPHGFLRSRVVQPYVDGLLANLAVLMERPVGLGLVRDELIKRQIRVLSSLATYVSNGDQGARLVALLSPMLRKPIKVVPEKVKVDILIIFSNLFPLVAEFADPSSTFFVHNYNLLSTLFQTLRSRPARQALSSVFDRFADADPSLRPIIDIAISLNSFSTRRMEEPDFDRRLAAFAKLNDELYGTLSVREWLPMIYNMLHHVQDPEELSIRANAAFSMRRFVEVVASRPEEEEFTGTFLRVLYPGLRNGLRSKLELVRTEILSVFVAAVSKCEHIPLMQEMRSLLAGGDDEASFFTNIHHIQTHRRTRALRRLTELCDEGVIRSSTLADIFLPLIAHFIVGAADKMDYSLINEAITATGRISRSLAWGAYNQLVRSYIRLAKEKTEQEKFFIRTVVALLDNFHFAMEEAVPEAEVKSAEEDGEVGADAAVDEELVEAAQKETAGEADAIVYPKVSQALKIAEAVESKLLPSLLSYLEQKDDTEDSIRIPIALGIVKVALNLPESSREAQIGRLLTILSQVFRSKSQETRDLAKDTMIKIAVTLGPEWLAQIVREMKGALQRGPQLHVLAFTIHAILVHVTSLAQSEFSDLDDCVTDVVNIASEVIFGESGKDLQAEGFKTKMREVRTSTSKGLDTFQLVARLVSPPKMSQLLLPIREILQTTEVLKVLQQVDDVLRRCASGLNSNERLNPSELLVLCHTLVGQNANFLKPKAKSTKLEGGRAKKSFHVDTKRSVAKDVDHYAANAHKFVSFGLDLFITAFRRGRFDFADQAILARLDPLVNIIGNTLYAGDSQVVVLGLKSTAALVKCPLETITTSMPVFIQQIFAIMKQEGGTESDVAQTALKTLAVILRDRKDVEIKEKQLGYLLEIISPDIEDPSRQTTLFGLLRAIISRKFVVADIYDLMERVSEIMVTSQSANVQELCRISVMQFLLDYPQGRGRLKKQMQFLAKNLSYVYESGRISVMEILSAIFSKFSVELVREYSDLFFVALVMVIANDESAKCREMAAELIKNLLPRLDEDLLSKTVAILHTWASQTSQPQLPRLASQVFGLVIDCLAANSRPFAAITLVDLQSILSHSATSLEAYETVQEEPSPFDMETDEDLDWQLPYQTLTSLAKLLRAFPDLIPSIEWKPIIGHLLFPHAWVRLAASRLVGTLFGSTPPSFDLSHTSPSDGGPLQPRGLFDLTRKSLLQLKGESIDEALAMQIVKNVVYLGRCFAAGPSDPGSFVTPVPEVVEEVAEEEMQEDQMGGEEEEQEEIEQEEEKPPVDEDEQGSEEEALQRALANPLAWLFTKLSQLARSILISRPPSHGDPSPQRTLPILSIFRLFAALSSILDPARTTQFLMQILHPVERVLDEDAKGEDELRNLATELQTLVQDKVGTTAFTAVYSAITRGRALKRQARRTERIVKTSTNPQFAAQRKQHKQDAKRDSHKRKISRFADSKLRERPMKARRTRDPMPEDD